MVAIDYITESGPDVRYEDGSFVAYANGQRVDAFDNSQLAWAAARSAVFAPVVETPLDAIRRDIEGLDGMTTEEMAAYCRSRAELFAQIDEHLKSEGLIDSGLDICEKCGQVIDKMGRCGCDYQKMPAVTVTHTRQIEGWSTPWTATRYKAGSTELDLAVQDDGQIEPDATLGLDTCMVDLTPDRARELLALLQTPDVQRWMGLDVATVAVECVTPDPTASDYDPAYSPYTVYSCNGVTVIDDGIDGFCLDSFLDTKVYGRRNAKGTLLSDYTDLEGLQRIKAAMTAIVDRVEGQRNGRE